MILDIKESTIKKQLERGREKLKDMMEGVYEIR
jgi:DNA-directed RNA polymerase specialized sigma24 family protein